MKTARIISTLAVAALTVSITGSNVNPPVVATVPVEEIRATFVAQDTQKEQDIIAAAVQRIEAERIAAKLEAERKEAERIAQEAETARIEAERVAAEEEAERVRVEAERIAAEEAEQVRIEAERLREEAEKVVAQPAPAAPAQSGEAWIQQTMQAYGVFAPAGTIFLVTDAENCGGPGGGCTTGLAVTATKMFVGPVTIRISPSAIGSAHLLFHEIAHSHNIIGECEAEYWAQNVTKDYNTMAYPHCFQ